MFSQLQLGHWPPLLPCGQLFRLTDVSIVIFSHLLPCINPLTSLLFRNCLLTHLWSCGLGFWWFLVFRWGTDVMWCRAVWVLQMKLWRWAGQSCTLKLWWQEHKKLFLPTALFFFLWTSKWCFLCLLSIEVKSCTVIFLWLICNGFVHNSCFVMSFYSNYLKRF